MAREPMSKIRAGLAAVVVLVLAQSMSLAGKTRGYVDGSEFVDLAGDEAVTVEISIKGALLKALTSVDEELSRLAGGLESIQAVILSIESEDVARRVIKRMREMEARLLNDGWERVARIKDEDTEVKVLVLNDDEAIHGLVVMVADHDEGEMVFANIAGVIDLAAISAIGQSLDIPGLQNLDLGDDDE